MWGALLQNQFIVIVTKAATKSTRMLEKWLSRSAREAMVVGAKIKRKNILNRERYQFLFKHV